MKIAKAVVGSLGTNCYFLMNDAGEVLIVDPADTDPVRLEQFVRSQGLKPLAVLLTHGHFDHILCAPELAGLLSVPVCALDAERALLSDPEGNCSAGYGRTRICVLPDRFFTPDEDVTMGHFSFRVLHTPGHTAGSCCFWFPEDKVLVCGDTLFRGSFGRTDLATGNGAQMEASVVRLLTELPEDTVCLPGHGPETSIELERDINPFAYLVERTE